MCEEMEKSPWSELGEALRVIEAFWGRLEYEKYHEVRSSGLSKILMRFALRLSGFWFIRVLVVFSIIAFSKSMERLPEGHGIIVYAPTQNNKRAANAIVQNAPVNFVVTYAATFGYRCKSAFLSVWLILRLAYFQCDIEADTPFVRLQKLRTIAAFAYFWSEMQLHTPHCVLIANDHSPGPVAFASAARSAQIATIYVQHAPINKHYPRLRFDLSILWNGSSKTTYSKAGELGDMVVYGPLFGEVPLPKQPKEFKRWGLLLSRVRHRQNIDKRLREICARIDAEEIIVRPHPADFSTTQSICIDPRIRIVSGGELTEFATQIDVAIVPGSGVALELINSGVMTAYIDDTDLLEHDPHGLVAAGVLKDVTALSLAALSHADFGSYDPDWRESAQQNFDQTPRERARKELDLALLRLLKSGD
ncbi:hypothetical protein Q4544_15515 [Cognatishimia sp. 1_MG-2023]|uniref:hypothetical protein n=1 Tax=Cognatishimia sp. 1_MG-2023 TaxID=3062642 RepID=UPI0026E29446|nr:hypothetical protein [Cognatishimia sp. 1_MG-2023]MDO6728348.1 hypothetical protein [Cognatishimia sp. 1_MG-2023]